MQQFNSIDFVMEERNKTLGEFIIENQNAFQYSSGELSRIINSIRLAAKVVNYKVNKAGLVDIVGAAGDQNIQGEDQTDRAEAQPCPYCIAHTAITPAFNTNLTFQAPQTLALLPQLFYQSPKPLAVWVTPPSAAPPTQA
mgnify:CR=1 FL=1